MSPGGSPIGPAGPAQSSGSQLYRRYGEFRISPSGLCLRRRPRRLSAADAPRLRMAPHDAVGIASPAPRVVVRDFDG